jgi:hypothetical protein
MRGLASGVLMADLKVGTTDDRHHRRSAPPMIAADTSVVPAFRPALKSGFGCGIRDAATM